MSFVLAVVVVVVVVALSSVSVLLWHTLNFTPPFCLSLTFYLLHDVLKACGCLVVLYGTCYV